MSYKIIIVKDGLPQKEQSFASINEAFADLGKLDFTSEVSECILDDGISILFHLRRDSNGRLSSIKN